MLVTNLCRVSPYDVSPSLRSCFIILLVEPKIWRLLLLSEGKSLGCVFLWVECLLHYLHILGLSFCPVKNWGLPNSWLTSAPYAPIAEGWLPSPRQGCLYYIYFRVLVSTGVHLSIAVTSYILAEVNRRWWGYGRHVPPLDDRCVGSWNTSNQPIS